MTTDQSFQIKDQKTTKPTTQSESINNNNTETARVRFFIVDDSSPFRKALNEYLTNELGAEVIGEASNGAEALRMDAIVLADIIVMDIVMKELDGISTARKLLWEFPHLKILAVTGNEESVFLRQLVHTGFYGCVFKNQIFHEMSEAIECLLSNKRFFPKSLKL